MSDIGVHTRLNVFIEGPYVVIQPADWNGRGKVESLSIDLQTCSVAVVEAERPLGVPTTALALLGLVKLVTGCALVVVTEAAQVATLLDCEIFMAERTQVITATMVKKAKENKHLLRLLKDGVDPWGSARSLYFSYYYDLTLSNQRMAAMAKDIAVVSASPAERAEPHFFWNKAMSSALLTAGAKRFVVPSMLGFVRQVKNLKFCDTKGKVVSADLTLIARRSNERLGTRHWRRGADTDGNVANFVETEQILSIEGSNIVASFVQIRGSVPLLWTEMPNMKYKPTRVIAPVETQGTVFDKHVASMVGRYQELVAVSLVNLHGGEGKLAAAFKSQSVEWTKAKGGSKPPFRQIEFDFHKECGTTRYHRISVLWDQMSADFDRWGFFLAEGGALKQQQGGVVRTNCIDCLDRTNVLQGVLARKALERILRKLGLMNPSNTLPEEYPDVEKEFKILWADHGDGVSIQYAGTGAMKSGFTRTGKRTFDGIIDDGIKAVSRYYLNNFRDGKKQDALDLISGCYTPDVRSMKSPIKSQPAPWVPMMIAVVALYFSFAAMFSKPAGDSSMAVHLSVNVLAPLILGVGLLAMVIQNGKHLVCRPQLCIPQADTVPKGSVTKSS